MSAPFEKTQIQVIRLGCHAQTKGTRKHVWLSDASIAAVCSDRVVLRLYNTRSGLHEKVWVVKQVEHLGLEPDTLALSDVKRPGQSKVNFVDPWAIERVVPDARHRGGAGDACGCVADRYLFTAIPLQRVF
jgi:hypothetical protein